MNEDKILEMAKQAISTMVDLGTEDVVEDALMEEGYDIDAIEEFIEACCQ